jgi:hypothetical protein
MLMSHLPRRGSKPAVLLLFCLVIFGVASATGACRAGAFCPSCKAGEYCRVAVRNGIESCQPSANCEPIPSECDGAPTCDCLERAEYHRKDPLGQDLVFRCTIGGPQTFFNFVVAPLEDETCIVGYCPPDPSC